MTAPGRLPTEERQAAIVTAALELARETSPALITTSDIAAGVGVTQGALFKHFPTKDAIWLAAMGWVRRQLGKLFGWATGPDGDGPEPTEAEKKFGKAEKASERAQEKLAEVPNWAPWLVMWLRKDGKQSASQDKLIYKQVGKSLKPVKTLIPPASLVSGG